MIDPLALGLADVARGALSGSNAPPLSFVTIQPGLFLSRTDLALDDVLTVKAESFPVASLGVMLEGAVSTEVETLPEISPGELLVISNNERRLWTSRVRGRIRNVEICVTPEWFEGQQRFMRDDASFDEMRGAMERPLHARRLTLTPQLRQVAREVFSPTGVGASAALRVEARAIDLLIALAGAFHAPGPCCCRSRDRDRAHAVRAEIERDPGGVQNLTELAARHGASVSKLKRDFFAVFGACVGGFVNDQRLLFGRRLIEGGMSVSQASYRAGYAHPSNFSTAFRRKFGHAPRETTRR